jgi:hypothetical protein
MRLFVSRIVSLGTVAAALCAANLMAGAQQGSLLTQRHSTMQLAHLAPPQMRAPDRALLDRQWTALASKAKLFGYALGQKAGRSDWAYSEVLSPDTPGYLMLSFEQQNLRGRGRSSFTALVSRAGEKIWIVPVLYGGATPWASAMKTKRALAIFNQVVPPQIAAQAVSVHGPWLTLALTYAEMVGVHPVVLAEPSPQVGRMSAPGPTILVGTSGATRTIEFSDLYRDGGYRVWTIAFNGKGQVSGAKVRNLRNAQPVISPVREPSGRMITNAAQPPVVIQHPRPLPQ